MPRQVTIYVSYDPNQDPPFQYSPDGGNVTMDTEGEIVWQQRGSGWSFTNVTFTPESENFEVVAIEPTQVSVNDYDATPGTFEYCLTIETPGGTVTSDPQIVNKRG